MTEATLVAHKDTVRVPEAVVRAVEAPPFTSTWRPYSHGQVLDALGKACQEMKLTVARKEYSITKNEARMFGVWEVATEATQTAELRLALGLRNSIDKHFAVGLCAGERVFVCDNLVFSGEFVLFRRHSGLLVEMELTLIAKEAIGIVMQKFKRLTAWHDNLKTIDLKDNQAALLTVAALRRGLIAPSNYNEFHHLYFDEDTKYSPSLHGWHGAVTELFKDQSLHTVHQQNIQLNRFITYETPRLLEPGKDFFDFGAITTQAVDTAIEEESAIRVDASRDASNLKRRLQRQVARMETAPAQPEPKKAAKVCAEPPVKKAKPAPAGLVVGTIKASDFVKGKPWKITPMKRQAKLSKSYCDPCGTDRIFQKGKCLTCGSHIASTKPAVKVRAARRRKRAKKS